MDGLIACVCVCVLSFCVTTEMRHGDDMVTTWSVRSPSLVAVVMLRMMW